MVDNGESGKVWNGDFVLLVGNFTKLGSTSGSDIRLVTLENLINTLKSINLY